MAIVQAHSISKVHARWAEMYPVLCLILLGTSPVIFLGEGNRNLGLIALMFIAPLFIRGGTLSSVSFLLLGFALSIVIFPGMVHSGGTRWSTIFYSLMFCGLFISYDSMLRRGKIRFAVFVNILRYLIIAYTVVLVIQQLCVLAGLPIFNVSNYDPSNPWKLNSLSAEPSHSARIMGLLMLSFLFGSRILARTGNDYQVSKLQMRVIWLCFFWTMITMVSATAMIMISLVLAANSQVKSILYYAVGYLLAVFTMSVVSGDLTERVLRFSSAALTLNYEAVLDADHSGAMRIAPMMVLFDKVEIFSASGLFGNGVDSVGLFMSDYIWGVAEGAAGGGLLALWYEYGLIAFLFFAIFTLKVTSALGSPANFLVWFIVIFVSGVNSQMVWLAIILQHTLNFYRQNTRLLAGSLD